MADVAVYIVGGTDENELVLQSALVAFCDALQILLRNQVERRSVLENFDLVMLCLDETIDNGCVSLSSRYGIVFFPSRRSTAANYSTNHMSSATAGLYWKQMRPVLHRASASLVQTCQTLPSMSRR